MNSLDVCNLSDFYEFIGRLLIHRISVEYVGTQYEYEGPWHTLQRQRRGTNTPEDGAYTPEATPGDN